tara:strand:+ start:441 stop:569 length:129 start_codon:yes stop_codon:yes gene_type:complete
MIKKVLLLFVISILVFSCGKKGEPIYEELKSNKTKINLKVLG